MNICERCNRQFKNAGGLARHKQFCVGVPPKRERYRKGKFVCPNCGLEIQTSRDAHVARCDGSGPRRRTTGTGQSWIRGKTYQEVYGAEKAQLVLAKMRANRKSPTLSAETEKGRSDKIRKKILARYAAGWEVKAGRCEKITYESPVAGVIKIDGKWELVVAKYLDSIGVTWRRNKVRFAYVKPSGSNATYCPDFYVDDWNAYVEVKGYETDLDRAKWSQFPENLEIWKKEKLQELGLL